MPARSQKRSAQVSSNPLASTMKTLLNILILICFNASVASAQISTYVNPGIKLGYAFGENGGFTFGYELSFVFIKGGNDDSRFGIVIDYDWVKDTRRLHLGTEYMYRFFGIDVGPTVAWCSGSSKTGFSVIPFGGLMILPYYNFTYLDNETEYHEIGTYVKLALGNFGWRN